MSLLNPEYKIDESSMSMVGANEYEMIELKTDNNVVTNDQVFRISLKDQSNYTNLSKSYLEIKFRLTKAADGAVFGAADRITLRKSVMSLFSRATLRINQQQVESVEDVALAKTIQSLLMFSQDYSSSTATNQFWYKDTGNLGTDADAQRAYDHAELDGNAADANSLAIVENPLHNSGFVKREAKTRQSKVVTCWLPLGHLFGFATVDKVVVNQECSIELTKSQPAQHIQKLAATDDAKLECQKLSWWVPRIRPSAEVDLALKSQMSAGLESEFLYHTWNAYSSTNLVGGQNTFRVLTTSEDIQYAFAVCRVAAKAQGTNAECAYRSDVTECEARLNGRVYPVRRYDQLMNGNDAGAEGTSRVYSSLLSYMGRGDDSSSGIQLSYDEFIGQATNGTTGQFIIPFDFTAKESNFAGSPSNLEVLITPSAAAVAAVTQVSVVVVSKRRAVLSYSGNKALVSVA